MAMFHFCKNVFISSKMLSILNCNIMSIYLFTFSIVFLHKMSWHKKEKEKRKQMVINLESEQLCGGFI